jgi:predicted GH43/DUF377 family glycosyl hydrolase
VKTPHKYGIVIPAPAGKMVDCPSVFRFKGKWYMVYIQFEDDPKGYSTQLAESTNLLEWRPLGTVLPKGAAGAWDSHQAAGGMALFDTRWGGSNSVGMHDGMYWMSYLGGPNPGYEPPPISISMASSRSPAAPGWQKLESPVLGPNDPDARSTERSRLFKSYVFRDERGTLGAPFVMFYNAHSEKDDERIFIATSTDMRKWKRYGSSHVLANPRATPARGVISGDPQIVRINGLWVMFYFGAFWKPGAFDTFAASRDLVNWTKWEGPHLIEPSEPWDAQYAHKPWVIKHDGVVYHFYCAVDKSKPENRSIALATSRKLR